VFINIYSAVNFLYFLTFILAARFLQQMMWVTDLNISNLKGVETMKKFITLSLLLGSMVFGVSSANAGTNSANALTANTAAPQIRVQIGRGNRRVRRVVTTTRTVRVGRQRFRETIRTTYLPNGRTRTQVIRRVRVR
jgi:hypothetical protein